ncbi:MAG TPA: hypothetical protein VMT35_06545 [Ignavibacteriaceae bacterium]|nr:hypothetical protein [Ignavibacteriaceae bacterium]
MKSLAANDKRVLLLKILLLILLLSIYIFPNDRCCCSGENCRNINIRGIKTDKVFYRPYNIKAACFMKTSIFILSNNDQEIEISSTLIPSILWRYQ